MDKSSQKISKMFNKTAKQYDVFNNVISCFTHKNVKQNAIRCLKIQKGAKILDLCCGSGDLSCIIKQLQPDSEVIGVDFSEKMLDIAKQKNPNVTYYLRNAENLNFENDIFDFVVMGFGLRNIETPQNALNEIYRVLKQGGKFLQLDFGETTILSKIYDKFVLLLMKILSKNPEAYQYLIQSKNEFPPPPQLIKNFEAAGFKYVTHKYMLFKIISFQIMQK